MPSPFQSARIGPDAGADAAAPPDVGAAGAVGGDTSVTLGAPCVDDAQCDDGFDCTDGACDLELGLCRYTAVSERCDDGVFCNGIERCDPRVGCRPGPPTSCSDSTPCTIDVCDEATRSCVRRDRDADGDGDVDGNCQPGRDCNDLDPNVSSLSPEVCNDGVDDDCDGEIDEAECEQPRFDTCGDALSLPAPGSYTVPVAGARLDYGAGCGTAGPTLRDLVLQVGVPAGPALDVELVVRSALGELSLSPVGSCGEALDEADCVRGAFLPFGESAARLRLHSLAPGTYPVYLRTNAAVPLALEVTHLAASVAPAHRDCSTPLLLEPDLPVTADLALPGPALDSACETQRGDLFYSFTLAQAADVQLTAESLDDLGRPRLALRAGCDDPELELSCNEGVAPSLHYHALAAGSYLLAVSASGPTLARLALRVQPPSTPPPTDQCSTAPALVANRTQTVSFIDHVDDIIASCAPGSTDAAFALDLASASDLLLVGRSSAGDVVSLGLTGSACAEEEIQNCSRLSANPARVSAQGLAAGSYRVVMESAEELPATLTAALRPARPRTFVPTSDACLEVLTIPPGGGLFQGNTQNADNDFSASCDFATPNGAPDQLLKLVLDRPQRVLLDMRGSDFDTLLNVRRGPDCPGQEVAEACAVGVADDRSFLDLNLPAGEYFLQIDGYAGALGAWLLDVFVMDP
ncbi:MAG TPA: putative metal-binding motif-containing protein [Polyangiaceae bacterium]|nr:putative metal-binding motif-containing protein [Polyangiaceae bacterium]